MYDCEKSPLPVAKRREQSVREKREAAHEAENTGVDADHVEHEHVPVCGGAAEARESEGRVEEPRVVTRRATRRRARAAAPGPARPGRY